MKKDNKKEILEKVNQFGFVKVNDLSKELSVTEVTVRSYLTQLESEGKLVRIHGGACKKQKMNYEPSADESDRKNFELKDIIAKEATKLIEEGDTIIIDTSSTCRLVSKYIIESNLKHITVITNSFRCYKDLINCSKVTLIHTGGIASRKLDDARGMITINTLKNLRARIAFIGSDGISKDGFITNGSFDETTIKIAMMESAEKSVALLDSTKFGQSFVSVVANVNQFDYMITDDKVNKKYTSDIDYKNCKLIVVPNNQKRSEEIKNEKEISKFNDWRKKSISKD